MRIVQRVDEIGAVPTDTNRAPALEYGLALRPVEASLDLARGEVTVVEDDLVSEGLIPWGHRRTYSNLRWYNPNTQGNRWAITQIPQLIVVSGNRWLVRTAAGSAVQFGGAGAPVPTFGNLERLANSGGKWYFTDTNGYQTVFKSAAGGWVFESYRAPSGKTLWADWVIGSGPNRLTRVWQAASGVSTDVDVQFSYEYNTAGANLNLLAAVQFAVKQGSSLVNVRRAEYEYYVGPLPSPIGDAGNVGDLKQVTIRAGGASGGIIGQSYYRYWPQNSTVGGEQVAGALRHLVRPRTYARLKNLLGTNPDSWTIAELDAQADRVLEYNFTYGQKDYLRVTRQTARGDAGADAIGAWKLTYFPKNTYEMTFTGDRPDYPDIWKEKVKIERFDLAGTATQTRWVYTNFSDQVLLESVALPADATRWIDFYGYDSAGRRTLHAFPDAVTGWNDSTYLDLVGKRTRANPFAVVANAQYLVDATGKFETSTYATATNATATADGDVTGALKFTYLRKGESGSNVLQSKTLYRLRTGFTSETIAVPSLSAVYAAESASDTAGLATTTDYTWNGTTLAPTRKTIKQPLVTSGNGSGSQITDALQLDDWGHVTWRKDPDGYLHYTSYDAPTGAALVSIADVDSTKSDFTGKPSDFTKPSDGGLHRKIVTTVDALGRTTTWTDPMGAKTYYFYDDVNKEYRVYPSWNAKSVSAPLVTAGAVLPPFQVRRENWGNAWREVISVASPTSPGAAPSGAETITTVVGLVREQLDMHGHVTSTRAYRAVPAGTPPATYNWGSAGTNYEETVTTFDSRGRPTQVLDAAGTRTWTDYDFLSRPTASFIGAAKVQTGSSVYDGGGVGNGNRTSQSTLDGTTTRTTALTYDWRDRLVSKTGPDFIKVSLTLDNLGRVTQRDTYRSNATDAAEATATTSKLGSREIWLFDEVGRVYKASTAPADDTGALQTPAALRYWHDQRGNLLKIQEGGGLLRKAAYDGLGRRWRTSLSTDAGDSGWSAARTLVGDQVIEQTDAWFNAASDQVAQIGYKRLDTAGGTGPLTPLTAVPSTIISWFDGAHRSVATATFGRDTGTTYVFDGSGNVKLTGGIPTEATTAPRSPNGSDDWQATSSVYNSAGLPYRTTDNGGRIAQIEYDLLGRKTKEIANVIDQNP